MNLKNICFILISFSGLVSTFYSVGNFMFFLSDAPKSKLLTQKYSILKALFIDLFLIIFFILQHSFMTLPNVKKMLSLYGLDVVTRSIYISISSLLLLVLIRYWQIIPQIALWDFDTNNNTTWTIFTTIHLIAWSIIYSGSLFMDITELFGIKQVYYNLRSLPDPKVFKSPELQQLYGHNRHPSFSALTLIFWCFPIMTLDRLLLASIFTLYMYFLWKTDKSDLRYQRRQYLKKQNELLYIK